MQGRVGLDRIVVHKSYVLLATLSQMLLLTTYGVQSDVLRKDNTVPT